MSLPLLKLPFLASVTWGINLTMTPPMPPPEKHESLEPTGIEIYLAPWFPVFAKVCGHYAAQVAEFHQKNATDFGVVCFLDCRILRVGCRFVDSIP